MRSFRSIVKDLEIKLGPLEVSDKEKTCAEEVAKKSEDNRTSAAKGVNKEDSEHTENGRQG